MAELPVGTNLYLCSTLYYTYIFASLGLASQWRRRQWKALKNLNIYVCVLREGGRGGLSVIHTYNNRLLSRKIINNNIYTVRTLRTCLIFLSERLSFSLGRVPLTLILKSMTKNYTKALKTWSMWFALSAQRSTNWTNGPPEYKLWDARPPLLVYEKRR